MSEYLVQRQSLENIADEIRVLSGTTEPLGLTEMATNVNDANDEVADQTELIAQVVSALQGKSVPGGGEDVTAETETYTDLLTDLEAAVEALPEAGSGGVETCTISRGKETGSEFDIVVPVYENGAIVSKKIEVPETLNQVIVTNAVKGAIMFGGITSYTGLTLVETAYGKCYQIDSDAIIDYFICFARNTLILLADGTTKPVQDIAYNDLLLVWDFDNGCYSAVHPLWIKQEQTASYYYRCEFDNGVVLRLVGSNGRCHRVFSLDRNMFESATECVGERVMTNDGVAKLVSCERIDEPVEFYNIITDTHLNLYAEGVLTSCRLNNLYPIKDMKFVKDDREILPLDAYDGVDETFYRGLRLAEQKSENVGMINDYVANLCCLQKEV